MAKYYRDFLISLVVKFKNLRCIKCWGLRMHIDIHNLDQQEYVVVIKPWQLWVWRIWSWREAFTLDVWIRRFFELPAFGNTSITLRPTSFTVLGCPRCSLIAEWAGTNNNGMSIWTSFLYRWIPIQLYRKINLTL